jgi:hypothetical protein
MSISTRTLEVTQETPVSESPSINNHIIGLIVLILLVLVSRIPFIDAGYGSDPDAWRLANVSRNISINHAYEQSRFPGHPVQEIVCAFFWKLGPVGLNSLTVIFSVIGILFFALALIKLNTKNYFLLSCALAFTPVIFINSVNSMDYIWALSFILAGFYFTVVRKPIASGILVGLAVGCRITSGAMIIPLCILLLQKDEKNRYYNIFKIAFSALLVGLVLYIPVYLRYGIGFLTFEDPGHYSLSQILRTMILGVWESLGAISIIFSIVYTLIVNRKNLFILKPDHKLIIVSCLSAIILFILAFFKLPYRSGYLIPFVPFFILLLYLIIDRKLIKFVFISIMLSSFFVSMYSSAVSKTSISSKYSINFDLSGKEFVIDFLKGPIFIDHSRRVEDIKYVNGVINLGRTFIDKSVVAVGDLLPYIQTTLHTNFDGSVEYIYLYTKENIKGFMIQNYRLYYLTEVRKSNIDIFGVDPFDYKAKPITVDY